MLSFLKIIICSVSRVTRRLHFCNRLLLSASKQSDMLFSQHLYCYGHIITGCWYRSYDDQTYICYILSAPCSDYAVSCMLRSFSSTQARSLMETDFNKQMNQTYKSCLHTWLKLSIQFNVEPPWKTAPNLNHNSRKLHLTPHDEGLFYVFMFYVCLQRNFCCLFSYLITLTEKKAINRLL